ncbi:MAG: lamin tail domain-containing protein [Candidatus Yanofskybacteria bacterium]|nr:lamin tail domain-containing protein [Candidatus Yanofskybacteria bacterium]
MGQRMVITVGLGLITLTLVLIFLGSNSGDFSSDNSQQAVVAVAGDIHGDTGVTNTVSPSLSPKISMSPGMSPSVSPTLSPLISSVLAPLRSILAGTPSISPTVVVTAHSTNTPVSSAPIPTSIATSPVVLVVINEIGWMGTQNSPSDEWIELFNAGNVAVDLSGWRLYSATDNSPNITLEGTIPAGGFYLLERTDDSVVDDVSADWKGSFGSGGLKDTGEQLVLLNADGNVMDSVGQWYAGDKVIRASMERIAVHNGGSDPSNWQTNDGSKITGHDADGDPIKGTPRTANSVSVGQ